MHTSCPNFEKLNSGAVIGESREIHRLTRDRCDAGESVHFWPMPNGSASVTYFESQGSRFEYSNWGGKISWGVVNAFLSG